MFKAIGKYGSYLRYEIDLGKSDNIKDLTVNVINRLNSIQPGKTIFIFIYNDEEFIGRIVKNKDIGDNYITTPLIFLNKEQFKEWQEKREKFLKKIINTRRLRNE